LGGRSSDCDTADEAYIAPPNP